MTPAEIEAPWRPSINPWIVAMTVTLATFMEVLDSSIANVALPHIAGGLGATQEEATWVLTAYLVANAIVLPAGAYLTTFIGRKKFYMICVGLFGISSALCGLAPTLPLLVFCRVLQGIGGGGLAPSEQAILAEASAAVGGDPASTALRGRPEREIVAHAAARVGAAGAEVDD